VCTKLRFNRANKTRLIIRPPLAAGSVPWGHADFDSCIGSHSRRSLHIYTTRSTSRGHALSVSRSRNLFLCLSRSLTPESFTLCVCVCVCVTNDGLTSMRKLSWLKLDTSPTYVWRGWGNPRETSVRIAYAQTEPRTPYFPNRNKRSVRFKVSYVITLYKSTTRQGHYFRAASEDAILKISGDKEKKMSEERKNYTKWRNIAVSFLAHLYRGWDALGFLTLWRRNFLLNFSTSCI
jgi:hypothetical protein